MMFGQNRASFFKSLLISVCLVYVGCEDSNDNSELCAIDKRACYLAAELAEEQSQTPSSGSLSMNDNDTISNSTEIQRDNNNFDITNDENLSSPFHSSTIPTSVLKKEHRLDDVSIDDADEDFNTNFQQQQPHHHGFDELMTNTRNNYSLMQVASSSPSTTTTTPTLLLTLKNNQNITTTITECSENGRTYKIGEKFNRGCEETCQCVKDGQLMCSQLCKAPYFKKGITTNATTAANTKKDHQHCVEETVATNPCCVMLRCASDFNDSTKPPAPEVDDTSSGGAVCIYKNETYKIGATFKDGCESICSCQKDRNISCKPRCPAIRNINKSCITVPDAKDPCCMSILCDVEGQDVNKIGTASSDDGYLTTTFDNQILSAVPLNGTSVKVTLSSSDKFTSKHCDLEFSLNGVEWNPAKCNDNNVVGSLQSGKTYHFRLRNSASNIVQATLPSSDNNQSAPSMTCEYKGKTYKTGDEFHDGCDAYCICDKTGVECAPIECPTDFGLDVLDPQCLHWETHPADFVPNPPNCCPDKVHCKDNGSCTYNGQNFPNWSEIPNKLSGCDKRCYCEMGNVTCNQVCPTVPEVAPATLPCRPQQAVLSHMPGDDCCLFWICPNNSPHGYAEQDILHNFPPLHGPAEGDIKIHILEAIDDTTVKLVFSVPPFLVGLHGRVELRYTSDTSNEEPSTWEQQILAPPNDLIATEELEFELGALRPNTTYKIKISVNMHDIANVPTSDVLTVKTLPRAPSSSTLPPIITIDPELKVQDINSTWAKLGWRTFTTFELQFIDGIQLRYKKVDDKVYSATPLIHRAVTTYTIEDLKPNSTYEFGIFFIPFAGQTTELQSQKLEQGNTAMENDPYKFDLLLDVHHVKASSVEINWSGVPYPEDKYINIYRAIYQFDGNREDYNTFKIAKRDSPQSLLIQELKPNTNYRLWLEAYLTNGRIKKSNVKDFSTKAGPAVQSGIKQGKLEGAAPLIECNSYYGPLVAVSILAALAIVSALILLLIVAKKHATNKAPITNPINMRKNNNVNSAAAYDNPSYKVDIQHETMDL